MKTKKHRHSLTYQFSWDAYNYFKCLCGKLEMRDKPKGQLTIKEKNEYLLEAAKYVRDRMFMAGVGNALPSGAISKHCYKYLHEAIIKSEGK